MAAKLKRGKAIAFAGELKAFDIPPVVQVAQDVAELGKRKKQIQDRLGVLNSEAARLEAEQHGIDLRLLELSRDFDRAARG